MEIVTSSMAEGIERGLQLLQAAGGCIIDYAPSDDLVR